MRVQQWVAEFLERRGLSKSDGRPLFQYRVEDNEFAELLNVLSCNRVFGDGTALKDNVSWGASFVIYASEWWRREYLGDNWSWEGIFKSLGIDPGDVSAQARGNLVSIGCMFWGRDVREADNGQRMFLGTIAAEGGLPLRQLAKSKGWMSNLFRAAVRRYLQFIDFGVTAESIILQQAEYIPQAYRKSTFFVLFGDIVKSVASLRNQYSLSTKSDPVAELDEQCPDWRRQFPLPLNCDVASSLLSDLIVEAAHTTVLEDEPKPQLHRFLKQLGEDYFSIETYIYLPEKLIVKNTYLPQRVELEVAEVGGRSWRLGVAYACKGDDGYILTPTVLRKEIAGGTPDRTVFLVLRHAGVVVGEISVIGGEPLQNNQPWMFVERGPNKWGYCGQAGCSTPRDVAQILVPDGLDVRQGEDCCLDFLGKFCGGCVYRLAGSLTVENEYSQFELKTGSSSSNELTYFLTGRRCKYQSSVDVFYGFPNVYSQCLESGLMHLVDSDVQFYSVSTITSQKGSLCQLGLLTCVVKDGSNILFKKNIGVLPEKISFTGIPDRSSNSGRLVITDHQNVKVSINDESFTVQQKYIDSDLNLDMTVTTIESCYFNSLLYWGSGDPLSLQLPFPLRGALLVGPDGRVSTIRFLFREALHGYRVILFDNSFRRQEAYVHFVLVDDDLIESSDVSMMHVVAMPGGQIEISLIDFVRDINELFAVAGGVDAKVVLEVVVDGVVKCHVDIFQYGMDLEIDRVCSAVYIPFQSIHGVPLESVEGVELVSMSLCDVGCSPKKLNRLTKEDKGFYWYIGDESVLDSALLIMPAKNSFLHCRPSFLKLSSHSQPIDSCSLKQAMLVAGRSCRAYAFQRILALMAKDRNHHDWDYLRSLYRETSHIPMASFEVFLCSCKDNDILSALALHMPNEFIRDYTDSVPVMWELVNASSWRNALSVAMESIPEVLRENDELVSSVKGSYLKRIDAIDDNIMKSIARLQGCDFERIPENVVEFIVKSAHQKLLQNHTEDSWPEDLRWQLTEIISECPEVVSLIPTTAEHQRSVVFLPFALALLHWKSEQSNWVGSPIKVFKLKKLKNFDKMWFEGTFPFLVAYFKKNHGVD